MKRVLNFTLIVFLGLLLFACSSSTGTKTEEEKQKEENVESETTNVLVIGEIENGDVYNGLKVKDYEFNEGGYFDFTLEGEFVVSGEVMIDEMWGEFAIMIDDENNPHKDLIIDIDGLEKQLISFCYFKNQEAFEIALDSEDLFYLQAGNTISMSVRVKDFSIGGEFDGYGDSNLFFLEIVQE